MVFSLSICALKEARASAIFDLNSAVFALIDQEGFIRCRIDENGNPIIYYNGLEDKGIQMIKEDIKMLL